MWCANIRKRPTDSYLVLIVESPKLEVDGGHRRTRLTGMSKADDQMPATKL
jgi:hypothetical protein